MTIASANRSFAAAPSRSAVVRLLLALLRASGFSFAGKRLPEGEAKAGILRAIVGVRATQPNEAWHVDTTVIRFLDGSKAYLHGVIDNFSRKVLAWTVAARLQPMTTCQVLLDAGA